MDECHAYLRVSERRGARESSARPSSADKGDVFIWSCPESVLAAAPIKDQKRTRQEAWSRITGAPTTWRATSWSPGSKEATSFAQETTSRCPRAGVEAARGPRLARGALGRAVGEAGGGAAGALMWTRA